MDDLETIYNMLDDVQLRIEYMKGYVRSRQGVYEHNRDQIKVQFRGARSPAPPTNEDIFGKIKQQLLNGENTVDLEIDFTEKEYSKLPRYFKKKFKTHGVTAHVRLKNNGVYEIRCRQFGLNVSGSSKLLEEAKSKFVENLIGQIIEKYKNTQKAKQILKRNNNLAKELQPIQFDQEQIQAAPEPTPIKTLMFCESFEQWFYEFKLPMVSVETGRVYKHKYSKHIKPFFEDFPLTAILPKDCQKILNNIMQEGKTRLWEDIYTLLKQFFEYAFENFLIEKNPMARIKFIKSERVTGTALSLTEERRLLNFVLETKYAPDILLMLYAGLRPCEIESAEIDKNFVTSLNRKQKKKSKVVKTKRIPITPMLKRYLYLFKGNWKVSISALNTAMRPFFKESPNHLYDLRHTFSTRAQECGVSQEIVSFWLGHTANTLNGQVYTHYSDEFLLSQSEKIDYKIPE